MPLSKQTVLLVAYGLAIISITLTIFAYVSPEFYNNNNISLIAVFPTQDPGTAPVPAGASIDGVTVILGVYGSCGRLTNDTKFVCVSATYPANYSSLDLLPGGIPDGLQPPTFFTALFWLALLLWFFGLLGLFVSSVFEVQKAETKAYASICAYLFLPFGFAIWLAVWMFFLKGANDFNACLKTLNTVSGSAPALHAQIGNVFALIGSAYICAAIIYIATR